MKKKFKRGIQRGSKIRSLVTGRVFKVWKVEVGDDGRKVFFLRHEESGVEYQRAEDYVLWWNERV